MERVTNNEDLRLKRIAKLVKGRNRVLDVGSADMPNPYLRTACVVGLDHESHDTLDNYTDRVIGNVMDLPHPFDSCEFDAITAGEILDLSRTS